MMKRSGCRQPEAKGQLAEVQRKRDGPEVERQRLMGWLEGEAADEQTRARLDEVLRRVRTRMGRLSDDERYEVVHAVIRDVRVDNQGGLKSPLTSLKAKIAQEAPLVVVLTSSS